MKIKKQLLQRQISNWIIVQLENYKWLNNNPNICRAIWYKRSTRVSIDIYDIFMWSVAFKSFLPVGVWRRAQLKNVKNKITVNKHNVHLIICIVIYISYMTSLDQQIWKLMDNIVKFCAKIQSQILSMHNIFQNKNNYKQRICTCIWVKWDEVLLLDIKRTKLYNFRGARF